MFAEIDDMTNEQAAKILKVLLGGYMGAIGRANGKTTMHLYNIKALTKAIELLEKTPDE